MDVCVCLFRGCNRHMYSYNGWLSINMMISGYVRIDLCGICVYVEVGVWKEKPSVKTDGLLNSKVV